MKTYKLKSWPDLAPAFHRTRYTRALSSLSHQLVTEGELQQGSGLSTTEVRHFLQHLERIGALDCCEMPELSPPHGRWRLWPLAGLKRRAA